jgi:hypothetical protein
MNIVSEILDDNEAPMSKIARLIGERDAATLECEQADKFRHEAERELKKCKAECAEMRDYIYGVNGHFMAVAHGEPIENLFKHIEENGGKVLSSDCGKDYFSRGQVMPLVHAINLFVEWCSIRDQVVTPEVIEAQYNALTHAKEIGVIQ